MIGFPRCVNRRLHRFRPTTDPASPPAERRRAASTDRASPQARPTPARSPPAPADHPASCESRTAAATGAARPAARWRRSAERSLPDRRRCRAPRTVRELARRTPLQQHAPRVIQQRRRHHRQQRDTFLTEIVTCVDHFLSASPYRRRHDSACVPSSSCPATGSGPAQRARCDSGRIWTDSRPRRAGHDRRAARCRRRHREHVDQRVRPGLQGRLTIRGNPPF